MEKEANLPAPSSSSTDPHPHESSRPDDHDLLRHVKAALKRHRPLGTMPSTNIKPRRVLLPQREPQRIPSGNPGQEVDSGTSRDAASMVESSMQGYVEQRKNVSFSTEIADHSSVTPTSTTETTTEGYIGNTNPASVQRVENRSVFDCKGDDVSLSSHAVRQPISSGDCRKKVQFSLGEDVFSQQLEDAAGNLVEMPAVNDHNMKQRDPQHMEASDISLRSDGGISSLLAKRSMLLQNPFMGKGISNPINQSSGAGSSSMTTISVHSKSAPALNSTTYSSRSCQEGNSHMDLESPEEPNVNPRHMPQGCPSQLSYPQYHCTSGMVSDPVTAQTQMSVSSQVVTVGAKDHILPKDQEGLGAKEGDKLIKGQMDYARGSSTLETKPSREQRHHPADVTDIQSQAPMTKSTCTSVKAEPSKSEHQEKVASSKGASGPRKKNYDPDVFVKVNGKLYQKLGKIGSGGSSEVYKVITSDCTIYALKRIKLKGRDYSTAYGFCQEIEYLNKLKGKTNIIQLIDYEVTDKTLLEDVMNGDMNIKDGKIRDDGYIYMVLEYGEIDLAHMLAQKWREQDSSSWTMDENWLRFFWQQILQAVNTIHEERIVHSDLKPANFLLVKGSLKLIDFGIAKAIMSDTTNIQRDSQVGTLSYMSPEAFMCNESDSEGNAIKCGRPSDIWSLGCILYQMVYGRTPFSEYKTFWQKFKVITDRNHKIEYGPVPNPWLLDLMKKCLAWERKDRWRIPQLLQHPFLVPPVIPPSPQMSQGVEFFQLIAENYGNDDDDVFKLCSQLQLLLKRSVDTKSPFSTLRDQHCVSLAQISTLCSQLREHLAGIER